MTRALIVGYGNMGRRHARVLCTLGVKVMTVDPCKSSADFPDLSLAAWKLCDFAVIATPIGQLGQVALDALIRGVPRIVIEKPMAATLGQAERLAKFADRVTVAYPERHNPAVRALNHWLDAFPPNTQPVCERVGRLPGHGHHDPALDLATHEIDTLRYLGFNPEHADIRYGYHPARKTRTLTVAGFHLDYQQQTLTFRDRACHVHQRETLVEMWTDHLTGGQRMATFDDGYQALAHVHQLRAEHTPDPIAV